MVYIKIKFYLFFQGKYRLLYTNFQETHEFAALLYRISPKGRDCLGPRANLDALQHRNIPLTWTELNHDDLVIQPVA
jgi:hypothetical protein